MQRGTVVSKHQTLTPRSIWRFLGAGGVLALLTSIRSSPWMLLLSLVLYLLAASVGYMLVARSTRITIYSRGLAGSHSAGHS